MDTIKPGSAGPEPGWYRDPSTSAAERYWNGRRWTEHTRGVTAAPAAARPSEDPTRGYVIAAYLMALLLPIVGFIMGIVLIVKNRVGDGAACIVLALVMGAGYYSLFTG